MEKWLKGNKKSDTSTSTSSIGIPETDTSSSTTSKRKNEFLPANNKKKTQVQFRIYKIWFYRIMCKYGRTANVCHMFKYTLKRLHEAWKIK
jgi:hypothetical protein